MLAQSGVRMESPATQMQQLMQQAVAREHFTGVALVVKDGATLLDQGYGAADLEWKVPNSPATKFRIGSLTKQFTAASFLLLEERGLLKLDDPVSRYMPEAPAAWRPITLYQLLTHTAGIPNFPSFSDMQVLTGKGTAPSELLARIASSPLDFTPGTEFRYSNAGYILLGALLEKISGRHFADFLQINFFTPLNMADTGIDDNHAILPHRAQGYQLRDGAFTHADNFGVAIYFSAGAMYSTTGDLLKWQLALFGGKVLKPASLKIMTTPHLQQYGLGVSMGDAGGRPLVTHNGAVEGFSSYMTQYPEDRLTVIVLANTQPSRADELGRNLGKIALGQPLIVIADYPEVQVAPALLAEYGGVYRMSPTFAIRITVEQGQLTAQATNQPKFALYARSDTRFFLKAVDAEVEFNREAAGKVGSLTLYQNGLAQKAVRE